MYAAVEHPDARHLVVLLNGEPCGVCTEADTTKGYIVRYLTHHDTGRPVIQQEMTPEGAQYRFVKEMVTGRVEIIDRRTNKPWKG